MPEQFLKDKTSQILNIPQSSRPSPLNPKSEECLLSAPPLLPPMCPPTLPYSKPTGAFPAEMGQISNFHRGPVVAYPFEMPLPVTQSRSSLDTKKRPGSRGAFQPSRKKQFGFEEPSTPLTSTSAEFGDDDSNLNLSFPSPFSPLDLPTAASYPLDFGAVDSCSSDVLLGSIPTTFAPSLPASNAQAFDFTDFSFSVPSLSDSEPRDSADLMADSDEEDTVLRFADVNGSFGFDYKREEPTLVSVSTEPKISSESDTSSRVLRNGKTTAVAAPVSPSKSSKPGSPVKQEPSDDAEKSGNPDDLVVSIGEYTRAERRRKIARFKHKQKNRTFTKKIIYKCRQSFAQRRPRVGGRFISLSAASASAASA